MDKNEQNYFESNVLIFIQAKINTIDCIFNAMIRAGFYVSCVSQVGTVNVNVIYRYYINLHYLVKFTFTRLTQLMK